MSDILRTAKETADSLYKNQAISIDKYKKITDMCREDESDRKTTDKIQKFSFWELYTSQWSFKNEGKTLLCIVLFCCGLSFLLF